MSETPPDNRDPVLRTKLHRPLVPADFLYRPRLRECLEMRGDPPVALVSAPAGYGKSLLVSDWVQSLDEPCAWLSLDSSDSNTGVFARYLITAIERVAPDACEKTRLLVQAAETQPVSVLVNSLANELDVVARRLTLVLDDYHRIAAASDVHELLRRLLARPPRGIRLVLVTRRDPPLGLTMLRAQGQLAEVRLGDLRFTAPETRALLRECHGFVVADDALDNLQQEMEGWAVGLRLVSLALQQVEDPHGFLMRLHGGVQHAREYLISEVVARQPPNIRDWLLKTSLLDRFCPRLCEALCRPDIEGSDTEFSGARFTHTVLTCNLFAVALDAHGEWFRYHHLFQNLLQQELERHTAPGEIVALHLRASAWFEAEGLIEEAIRHALAADASVLAAEIVERHRRSEQHQDRWWNIERWLALLPSDLQEQRPGLLLAQAFVFHYRHRLASIVPLVERIQTLTDRRALEPLARGELNLFEGSLCYWSGRFEEALGFLRAAREDISPSYAIAAGFLEVYHALAGHMTGQGHLVLRSLDELIAGADLLHPKYRINLLMARGFVQLLCGSARQAADDARQLRRIARHHGIAYNEGWGRYLEGIVCLRAQALDQAVGHFSAVMEHRYLIHVRAAIDGMAGLVFAQQALGQTLAAKATLEQLLELAAETGNPGDLAVARSCEARLALALGDADSAANGLGALGGGSDARPLFIWLENPAITRARVLVAVGSENSLRQAQELLGELLRGIEALHNDWQRIEILVLQAAALEKLRRSEDAIAVLEDALILAEPEEWIHPFIETGPLLAGMLRQLAQKEGGRAILNRLLDILTGAGVSAPAPHPGPVESLTVREMDILDLLTQRLRNKEIARRLSISEETVKFHLKNLYHKLGVGTRRQAVVRAQELAASVNRH